MPDILGAKFSSILALMSDGENHSGEELGELLGVSRTAVWKQLQKLELLGVPLESRRGHGYRIPGGLELLDRDKILSEMGVLPKTLVSSLDIFPEIDSTNRKAMDVAQTDGDKGRGAKGYVCLAEYQSGGRGRRGRAWSSPFGQNIYLSLVAEFTQGAAALEGLSLAVGVALVKALERCGARSLQLKWPNDVLCDNRKLAGILLEMTGDPLGLCRVVVGIGVNIKAAPVGMAEVDQPWINAVETGVACSRNQVVSAMLDELMPLMLNFSMTGFPPYREVWESLNAHQDKEVCLESPTEKLQGVVLGVTDSGALRLLSNGVEEVINGGEISLRSGGS